MNSTRTWVTLAALVALGWLIYELRPILMPFLVGAALAYFGDPLADRLEKVGLNRTLAVVVVFAGLFLVILIALLIVAPMLWRQIGELVAKIPNVLAWVRETALPWLEARFGISLAALDVEVLGRRLAANWSKAGGVLGVVLARTTESGLALIGWFANLALIPVVAFYLLRDWDVLMARIHAMLPRPYAATITQLARECDEVLSAFVRGQFLVMLGLGIIYSVGLWLIGLDLALLIGMLSGLASIVPYLGFIIGIVAATIAAFFQFGDILHLLLVWGVFGIGQVMESAVLTPLLVGDRIGLHPVAVIFAVLAGGQLFGFIGILLALPVAAVVMVLVRHGRDRYLNSSLYGA